MLLCLRAAIKGLMAFLTNIWDSGFFWDFLLAFLLQTFYHCENPFDFVAPIIKTNNIKTPVARKHVKHISALWVSVQHVTHLVLRALTISK